MKIVVIASEAVPFAKTGGLADVAGSLPPALERLGHEVSLIVPCHRSAKSAGIPLLPTGVSIRVPVDGRQVDAEILSATLPRSNVSVYLIDQPAYFDREGLYQQDNRDHADNCERFLFFCRAVLETIRSLDLRPDVIHGNDWQSGLIPVYLNEFYRQSPEFADVGTLLTIHNLAYQGSFWHLDMPLTGLDWRLFHWQGLEFHGKLNFLKAGLVYSDMLNTVSPTYAREIQTPEFGCGLDGLLRNRSAELRGIVNGIDVATWNPRTDGRLVQNYNLDAVTPGKASCKAYLQRRSGLPERPDVPVFAQIGRLDPQKGWDLVASVAEDLLREDVQLVVLGTGLHHYHELLDRLADRHPGKVRVFLEFSNDLAHQIEAGADLFLMPSLYEPCGLNQLYSQAYGTIPIVRSTGGLADTVVDVTPWTLADGSATGFAFREANAGALRDAIHRALALWSDRSAWSRLVRAAMAGDWSWDRSAGEYAELYEDVVTRRSSRVTGFGSIRSSVVLT